jgi:tRNA 2-thiouridine synthesizing protein A
MSEINVKEIKADDSLDARGMGCPMPLLKAKKAIEKLESGQVLEIIGTDPGSKNDFPNWAQRTGNEYLGFSEESDYFKFYMRKK